MQAPSGFRQKAGGLILRFRILTYALENIWLWIHTIPVPWRVFFHAEFEPEFDAFDREVQDELLAQANLLKDFGPLLKRPTADTLRGSKHENMKELGFKAADGVWRIAFAFDPGQKAILLAGGDKSGGREKRFIGNLLTRPTRGSIGILLFQKQEHQSTRGRGSNEDSGAKA